MLNIFNQLANLASGTLAVAAAVANAAPQVSQETKKQATLDLTGVALHAAANAASVNTTNSWLKLATSLLPAIYDEVMTIVNKHGLIAGAVQQQRAGSNPPAAEPAKQ